MLWKCDYILEMKCSSLRVSQCSFDALKWNGTKNIWKEKSFPQRDVVIVVFSNIDWIVNYNSVLSFKSKRTLCIFLIHIAAVIVNDQCTLIQR